MNLETSTAIMLLHMVDEVELVALSARLTSLNFQVLPVRSLYEGRRALIEHAIDCAFVEVRSTNPTGLSVIRSCRAAMPLAPVVALSSNKDLASRTAARDAGAEHYLATPVRNVDLEMVVAKLRQAMPQLAVASANASSQATVGAVPLIDEEGSSSAVRDDNKNTEALSEPSIARSSMALPAVPLSVSPPSMALPVVPPDAPLPVSPLPVSPLPVSPLSVSPPSISPPSMALPAVPPAAPLSVSRPSMALPAVLPAAPLSVSRPSRVLPAVPLPQPRGSEHESQSHLIILPQAGAELIEDNQRLREEMSVLMTQLRAVQKSEAAALRDRADILQEMQRRDGAAQLALTQARTLLNAARGAGRSAPSIAGGHPPDTDPLTGLISLGPLQDHLDREFARARRYGHSLSVLRLDLDRLARYHKSYGPTACDRALCLVADVLRSALRSPDIAARGDDDDFVVLATDTTGEQALLLADRLRAALREEGQHTSEPAITVSIGIASTARQDCKRADDLLQAAQTALRQAKEAGRNRCVIAAGG